MAMMCGGDGEEPRWGGSSSEEPVWGVLRSLMTPLYGKRERGCNGHNDGARKGWGKMRRGGEGEMVVGCAEKL